MMRGWGDRQRSYNEVRQIFNETFRDENTAISRSTVEQTVKRFNETGSVKNRQIPGRPISAMVVKINSWMLHSRHDELTIHTDHCLSSNCSNCLNYSNQMLICWNFEMLGNANVGDTVTLKHYNLKSTS